jgi:hypothetical protein
MLPVIGIYEHKLIVMRIVASHAKSKRQNTSPIINSIKHIMHVLLSALLQDLLELLLLRRSQACRVLDLDADDEVAPLRGRLALRHTLSREAFFESGLRGSCAGDVDLLAVDRGDLARPAGQGFLQVDLDDVADIVVFAGE